MPRSFSAPFISRIVLESTPEDTENAILDGILALIRPVRTLTDGLWVAMIRWIPAARASWARRQIASSTSPGATIIRSASSSTMITICGIFSGAFSPSGTRILATFFVIFSKITYPIFRKGIVTAGHLGNSPVQRTGRFLRICDHRNEQVRDPVVYTELHHLSDRS